MVGEVQRALSALLWRLFAMLGVFAITYVTWNAPIPALYVSFSRILSSYALFLTASSPTTLLACSSYLLRNIDLVLTYLVLVVALTWKAFYQRTPNAVILLSTVGYNDLCYGSFGGWSRLKASYKAAHRSVLGAIRRRLPQMRQPGADTTQVEAFGNHSSDTDTESLRLFVTDFAEPEETSESEQPDMTNLTSGPTSQAIILYNAPVGDLEEPQTQTQAGLKKAVWFTLSVISKIALFFAILGVATWLAHNAIDAALESSAVLSKPMESTALFETEAIIPDNMPKVPIPVPVAEFTPTGMLCAPSQAVPTPTPAARSSWIGITTPIPMPTAMQGAAPEPVPEPELLLLLQDEALDLMNIFKVYQPPDMEPLLVWYSNLDSSTQYAVIAGSLFIICFLFQIVLTLVAILLVLAVTYFTSAAVFALLLFYRFSAQKTIAIGLPAAIALNACLLFAYYSLRDVPATCWSNLSELANLRSGLEALSEKSKWGLYETQKSITALNSILNKVLGLVASLNTRVGGLSKDLDGLNEGLGELRSDFDFSSQQSEQRLGAAESSITACKDVFLRVLIFLFSLNFRKADRDEVLPRIDQLTTAVDGLKESKASADTLRAVQDYLSSHINSLTNDRKTDHEEFSRRITQLTGTVDGHNKSKVDAKAMSTVLDDLISLRSSVESLKKSKADDSRLESLRSELAAIPDLVERLTGTKAEAIVVGALRTQFQDDLDKAVRDLKQCGQKEESDRCRDQQKIYHSIDSQATLYNEHNRAIEELKEDLKALKEENLAYLQKEAEKNNAIHERLAKLETENQALKSKNEELTDMIGALRQGVSSIQEQLPDIRNTVHNLQTTNVSNRDLELHLDVLSCGAIKQHEVAMEANRDLSTTVLDFAAQTKKGFARVHDSLTPTINGCLDPIKEEVAKLKADMQEMFAEAPTRPDAADRPALRALDLATTTKPQHHDPAAQVEQDDLILSRMTQIMERYLASDNFLAAIQGGILTIKKQSRRDRLRAQVQVYAKELLEQQDIQEKLYTNFIERKALDNSLFGNPQGLISRGRATSPGSMSPNNTITTPTVTKGPTIPDDGHQRNLATHGNPREDPHGLILVRPVMPLDGHTSSVASSDYGGAEVLDDDALDRQSRLKGKGPCEADGLTYAQLYGPAEPVQPRGEEEEEEKEEEEPDDVAETDDDIDDNLDDDSDSGSDEEDDGPSGSPPGNNASYGQNEPGGNDDYAAGPSSNQGDPVGPLGPGTSNSPSGPPPSSSDAHSREPAPGGECRDTGKTSGEAEPQSHRRKRGCRGGARRKKTSPGTENPVASAAPTMSYEQFMASKGNARLVNNNQGQAEQAPQSQPDPEQEQISKNEKTSGPSSGCGSSDDEDEDEKAEQQPRATSWKATKGYLRTSKSTHKSVQDKVRVAIRKLEEEMRSHEQGKQPARDKNGLTPAQELLRAEQENLRQAQNLLADKIMTLKEATRAEQNEVAQRKIQEAQTELGQGFDLREQAKALRAQARQQYTLGGSQNQAAQGTGRTASRYRKRG